MIDRLELKQKNKQISDAVFCDDFHVLVCVLVRARRALFVNRVQQLFTAERLLVFSARLSKCRADLNSITV